MAPNPLALTVTMSEPEPRFSPLLEEELRRAGWFPERQVRAEVMESWCYLSFSFLPGHCCITPRAFRFLEEFGGLHLRLSGNGVDYTRESLTFDPIQAIGRQDQEWPFLELALDDALFPVGIQGNDDTLLILGASGRFYGSDPGGYRLLGTTVEQALEALIQATSVPTLKILPFDEDIIRQGQLIIAARAKATRAKARG